MSDGIAALVAWLLTAGLGGLLLLMWVARGRARAVRAARDPRPEQDRPPPYIPRALAVVHMLLAVAGLVLWSAYLLHAMEELAAATLAVLGLVALLGGMMFVRWVGSRRLRRASRTGSGAPAESLLPLLVVAGHGLLGITTVTLVIVTVVHT